MKKFFEDLKYQKSTLTNLLFLISVISHVLVNNLFTAIAFFALTVSSFMFHYYTAMYHQALEGAKGFSKKMYNKMKQWQYADVSSIYLIFAMYPYELSGNVWWLLYLIPMSFMMFNKFNILLPEWNPSTRLWVPLSAIPMVVLGFMNISAWSMGLGILFFALAGLFSKEAEELVDEKHYEGYDQKHGFWHKFAAIAFSFIK